jgi:hypothetical protein
MFGESTMPRIGKAIPSSLLAYQVQPQATDNAIDNWLDPHYVAIDPTVPLKGKLFLFFCGSYGSPNRQRDIIHCAAQGGYHAIGLSVPNTWRIAEVCANSLDEFCHEKARLEIIDGERRNNLIQVDSSNCLINRLTKLLLYLDRQLPHQGWRQYFDGHELQWQAMIVAGHSQGAGHAALLAKDYRVDRVVMFSGPADTSRVLGTPAPWISAYHITPAECYYGFTHVLDVGIEKLIYAWELLGMANYGPVINIDDEQSPYQHSHCLVTGIQPARPGKFHGSVVVDHATPRLRTGGPVLKEVWRYLCGLS